MLDGWMSSGKKGSSLTRPDSTSALMSRSESSTLATYRFRAGTGSLSGLCLAREVPQQAEPQSSAASAVVYGIRYDVGAGRVGGRHREPRQRRFARSRV